MCSLRNAESDSLLCVHCLDINMSDLRCVLGYKHKSTYTDLLQSSRSCNLCALLSAAVEKTLQRWRHLSGCINGSCGPVRLMARQHDWKSGNQDQKKGTAANRCSSEGKLAIVIGGNANLSHAFSDFGAQIDMFTTKGRRDVSCLLNAQANSFLYLYKLKTQRQRDSACHPYIWSIDSPSHNGISTAFEAYSGVVVYTVSAPWVLLKSLEESTMKDMAASDIQGVWLMSLCTTVQRSG